MKTSEIYGHFWKNTFIQVVVKRQCMSSASFIATSFTYNIPRLAAVSVRKEANLIAKSMLNEFVSHAHFAQVSSSMNLNCHVNSVFS